MPGHKTVDCKIFSIEGHTLLAKGTIRISPLNPQSNSESASAYEGQISFLHFIPDLDSKSVILEIMPGISGAVFLQAPTVQKSTTRLGGVMNVYFEDSFWANSDWFNTL